MLLKHNVNQESRRIADWKEVGTSLISSTEGVEPNKLGQHASFTKASKLVNSVPFESRSTRTLTQRRKKEKRKRPRKQRTRVASE